MENASACQDPLVLVQPVNHVRFVEQAEEQACVVLRAGADGVFLIDHGSVGRAGLLAAFELVRTRHPETFTAHEEWSE